MSDNREHTMTERVAQVISDLFSPIVLPAYMMAVAMWLSPLVAVPERTRLVSMAVVVALTAIIPTAVILTLIKLGKVRDVSLSSRSERMVPYVVSILCYIATVLFLRSVHAPMWLCAFYLGAALTSVCAAVITRRWKISAHSSAVGGVAAALVWMGFRGLLLAGSIWWVTGGIILCGLVGTSRLILHRHTPAQVFAGYALGAASVTAMLFLLAK